MEENTQWRAIAGWPDYEVSRTGEVRKISAGIILKPYNGQVRLSKDRKHRTFRKIENLISESFKEPYLSPRVEDLSEPGEIWRRITWAPDYMVSSHKRVWSWKTLKFVGKSGTNGKPCVLFSLGGEHRSMNIDKIHAEAFGYNPPTLPGEIWKESEAPGIWVSNLGRLYSTWNLCMMVPQRKKEKDYIYVKDRYKRQWPIHRLVAFAFVPGRDMFRDCVDHINEDKKDNRACNLRWCTVEENNQYWMNNHTGAS